MTSSTLEMRCKHFFFNQPNGWGKLTQMVGKLGILGKKFGSQGITALYPYSRYNGMSTNEVDLYFYGAVVAVNFASGVCIQLCFMTVGRQMRHSLCGILVG